MCSHCKKLIFGIRPREAICKDCNIVVHWKDCRHSLKSGCRPLRELDLTKGIFRVTVNHGLKFPKNVDIYCLLSIDGQTARSKTSYGSSFWNETFVFLVFNAQSIMTIDFYEQKYKPDKLLGSVYFSSTSVESNKETLLELHKGQSNLNIHVEVSVCYKPLVDCDKVRETPTKKKDKSSKRKLSLSDSNEVFGVKDHFGFTINHSMIDLYLTSFESWLHQKTLVQVEYYNNTIVKYFSAMVDPSYIPREVYGFCKAGIPLAHRHEMWQLISGSRKLMNNNPKLYRQLLEKHLCEKSTTIENIETDLHRTFVNNPLLQKKEDIEKLKRVLVAFSFHEGSPGYCQSLNFIAAFFLLQLEEEAAYWLLTTLVQNYLADYYSRDLSGFKTDSLIFEMLVRTYFPEIHDNLFKLGLPLALCTASWFMCLYINILPIETVMRIFDWIFAEGSHILFSVGLALFELNYLNFNNLSTFDEACNALNNISSKGYDPDLLFSVANKYTIEKDEILALRMKYSIEMKENDKLELLRESELTEEEFNDLVVEFVTGSEAKDQISLEKFTSILSKILPNLPSDICAKVFKVLDEDGDNQISSNEFLVGISSLSKGDLNKKAKMWFNIFDKDGNGCLGLSELKSMFETIWKIIDKNLDNSWMDMFLEIIETSHGGQVRFQEFISTLESLPVLKDWVNLQSQVVSE